ncbi:MAG: coproporphyrinogen dehydrogenase HemZ [Lachnospiraceae bacterium]|nr:coproporphyrinogen dehydrogenase HemZ [Lachnospiraceae bacterium]
MIVVLVNEPKFEYDIHSLVKAFYPKEDVKVITDNESVSDVSYTFKVSFTDGLVSFFDEIGNELSSLENPANSERVTEKNIVKKLIYDALSKKEGRTLVWGDLTGIRPTKIPRKLLEEGKSDSEIIKYMQDTYFVSDEKANLSIDIAKREIEILKPLREKGYSIYIGIPFCPTTCLYCSFTSNPIAKWRDRVSDYLSALEKEIKFVSEKRKGKTIDTIYIGGGTPTTLNAEELDRLLTMIDDNLDVSKLLEYTVEAGRADSITLDKLKVLKAHNVTRISVNPQTMNQKTLDIIGRRHTVEDVIRAFNDARSEGFTNINMDIILGLPEEGIKEVSHTLEEIEKLNPDSLTVHSLAIKRASRLNEWILQNGYATMINTAETMKCASDSAMRMGMHPYYLYRQKNMAGNFENTGYSKEGCYGIYNILIMEELEPIVALGPGSVSKILTKEGKPVRSDNVKDVSLYIEKIDEMLDRKDKLFALED